MVGSQVDSIPPTLCPTANKIRFRTFGMNTLRNLADTCMLPAEILTDIAILELVSFPSSFFFFPLKRDTNEVIKSCTKFFDILLFIISSRVFAIHISFLLLQSHDSWQGHDGDQVSIHYNSRESTLLCFRSKHAAFFFFSLSLSSFFSVHLN